MMLATSVMKTGMETVTLSIPLLVLQTLGGATIVAGLVAPTGWPRPSPAPVSRG